MKNLLFIILCLTFFNPVLLYSQNFKVIKPIGGTIINQKNNINKPNITSDVIDTLSYRKSYNTQIDINWNVYGNEYMVMWYEAPADMFIKAIGGAFATNDNNVLGSFKIYKIGNGITLNDLRSISTEVKQGRFVSADSSYGLGYVGFEDESNGSGYQNVGVLPTFPFAEDIWSDNGNGYTFTPVPTSKTSPTYQFIETNNLGFEPTILREELFVVVFKNESPNFTSDGIGIWANNAENWGTPFCWKFYPYGRIAGDTSTVYWYTRNATPDFAVLAQFSDTPMISFIHTPPNPVFPGEQIELDLSVYPELNTPATVNYSYDDGNNWDTLPMTQTSTNNYTATLPVAQLNSEINYFFTAVDTLLNINQRSLQYSLDVYSKQNDVLFIYNSDNYSGTYPQRLYIGYPVGSSYIINPVANDVWLPNYDINKLAQVIPLYNYIIQVDGSYPVADFSAVIKEYLDGASATSPRNYFLSSQDYGCMLNGTCADTTFTTGDFQYDYLGISKLGPQDLTETAGAKVEITPVAGDPISGWVSNYNNAQGVTYWYDPFYELGFIGFIDAITPTPSATSIYTSNGKTVGVRNNGENWKTAFITYDYVACNFRSDTSLTQDNDPKYAWGITVGNQALAFLQWSNFTDVKETNGNVPTKFSLSQNYPNPFNPSTIIKYSIPNIPLRGAKGARVQLKIYDILGKEVATLVNEVKPAGNYQVIFDGAKLSSGVYFYTLRSGRYIETRKMLLLR